MKRYDTIGREERGEKGGKEKYMCVYIHIIYIYYIKIGKRGEKFNYKTRLIWYDQRVSCMLTVLHYAVIWALSN